MTIIASWDESKWLVLSSCLFTLPACYAYYHEMYSYASLLVLTSVVSANFWRDANYSWRRDMDLVVAKRSLLTFISTGVIYVRYIPYMVAAYPGLCALAYAKYLSGKLWENKNPDWYKYHVLFHIVLCFELFIVLDSVRLIHKQN
jgi:hypothetical protein